MIGSKLMRAPEGLESFRVMAFAPDDPVSPPSAVYVVALETEEGRAKRAPDLKAELRFRFDLEQVDALIRALYDARDHAFPGAPAFSP